MKRRSPAATAATIMAVLLLILALCLFWRSSRPPELPTEPSPAVSQPPGPSVAEPKPVEEPPLPAQSKPHEKEAIVEEDDGLPTDKFFTTVPRQNYQDGDLRLLIPKLEVDVPILNGVDKNTLLRGEGLYDYAQLPSETRSNTSIAGHRNWIRNGKITLDQPFSYIDTLCEGDYLYLVDSESIYQYVFEFQEVVEPDDWGPIYKTDHSCVTLTTCTPIGISDHRLIVRGKLTEITPVAEDYPYPADVTEEEDIEP